MTAQPHLKVLTKFFLVSALATSFLSPAAQAQLDSALVPKFVEPLDRVCGLDPYTFNGTPCLKMPATSTAGGKDVYDVAAREKYQQILPGNFPKTKVWAFGPAASPASSTNFHYPGSTIVATENRPVQVKWINDLRDPATGNFIPSFLPIDQANHWANPPSTCEKQDHQPLATGPDCFGQGPNYTGPVPIVVHLHGSHTTSESDGIPEAWWLPAASNIPSGYAKHGSDFCQVNSAGTRSCTYNNDGTAMFQYRNDQFPATLFYHDHTLGITEQNVYAWLVGYYLISDHGTGAHDVNSLPSGPYEIPLVIHDKSFNPDGSLLFTTSGNMMVVNGKTWPFLEVEPRRYRFRIVDGADESFYSLSFEDSGQSPPITQIGGDAGFLPAPVRLNQIDITPGERVDVIIDFTGLQGSTIVLGNNESGDLGKVLQFRVDLPLQGTDTTVIPSTFPSRAPLGTATVTRKVALFDSGLGIVTTAGKAVQIPWDAPVTETPGLNNTETWWIYNVSGDAHPIHLHEVGFEVLERVNLKTGKTSGPKPGETGFKDTVLVQGNTITKIKAKFDIPGLFAWHCHIIEHEDNQMMRPMCILDPNDPTGSTKCVNNP